jgi:hypothetical protein
MRAALGLPARNHRRLAGSSDALAKLGGRADLSMVAMER